MKKILKYLPIFISKRLIYKSIKINYCLSDHITFKIAETKDEILQALKLLQQTYKQEKLAFDNEEIRATIYHALPSTTIIIAKLGNEVVGTISHVSDSAIGLPLEKIFDLSHLRKDGGKICEFSSLAIKKQKRGRYNHLSLYIHLMAFIFKYSYYISKDDYLLIATHPKALTFFQALFPFSFVSKEVKTYDFVRSSPALAQYVHLTAINFEEKFEHYLELPSGTNKIYDLFVNRKIRNYKLPKNSFCNIPERVLSPEELKEIFIIKSQTFKNIDIKEKTAVSNLYNLCNYKDKIQELDCTHVTRQQPRFNLTLFGHLNGSNLKLRVMDISKDGLRIILNKVVSFKENSCLLLELKLEHYDSITLQAKIAWQNNNALGLKIYHLGHDDRKKWNALLKNAEMKFIQAA